MKPYLTIIAFLILTTLFGQFSDSENSNSAFSTNSPFSSETTSSSGENRGFIGPSNNTALTDPDGGDDPDVIPIDNGIWYLLIAGMLFATYKLKKQKTKTVVEIN